MAWLVKTIALAATAAVIVAPNPFDWQQPTQRGLE